MSMADNIKLYAARVGQEFSNINLLRGDLTTLDTADKTSLVNALNELHTEIDAINIPNLTDLINDAAGSGVTDKTYSVDKILALIEAAKQEAKQEIIGGASTAYDTLLKLQNELQSNDGDIAQLIADLGSINAVTFNANQGLTATQQLNARNNIDVWSKTEVGDVTCDFVAELEANLNY